MEEVVEIESVRVELKLSENDNILNDTATLN